MYSVGCKLVITLHKDITNNKMTWMLAGIMFVITLHKDISNCGEGPEEGEDGL